MEVRDSSEAPGPVAQAVRDLADTASGERFSVVIAGGGVAALEAVLELRHLAPGISIDLVSPQREFSLRQFSVGQPFGAESPRTLDLAEFCRRNDVTLRKDHLAEVWGGQYRVLLASGDDIAYDALLLATGARPKDVLPGAKVFRGPDDVRDYGAMLGDLEHGRLRHLAFAVPREVRWALPLYELALMTARLVRARDVHAELNFFTHEPAPLMDLGSAAGQRISEMFEALGIELHCDRAPAVVEHHALRLADGHLFDVSEVISLPALRVPDVPGVTQGRHGFIPTGPTMSVEGMDRVWAAGDATWFPVKQGGIAAQMADVAAASIVEAAGIGVEVPAFVPVVRGALLTGDEPEFFSSVVGGGPGQSSAAPLWWPPGKVAGKWLAPYLAREWSGSPEDPLAPLEARDEGDAEARARSHREALDLALRFADVDANEGEFASAVRWLDIAERLNLTLPAVWSRKRAHWSEIASSNH